MLPLILEAYEHVPHRINFMKFLELLLYKVNSLLSVGSLFPHNSPPLLPALIQLKKKKFRDRIKPQEQFGRQGRGNQSYIQTCGR